MKKYASLATFLLCVAFVACTPKGEKLTAEQIEERYASSVTLVQNTYYYSAELGDMTFYFSGLNENGELENLTSDEDEIVSATSYGTGFFVSDDGKVVTNEHVVLPSVDTETIREKFSVFKRVLTEYCEEEISNYNDTLAVLRELWRYTDRYSEEETAVEGLISVCNDRLESMRSSLHKIQNLNVERIHFFIHATVGIALNNTFITRASDFQECVTIREDESHDLAVIQLKNKRTPENCGYINVEKAETGSDAEPRDAEGEIINVDKVPLGTHLYMIGFNLGPHLALTKDGIKAQVTEGSISQNTDEIKMLYSIPALHGSSGSPVVDEYGNFIAINFAGLDITQSFNYGIKVKHLRRLLDLD